MFHIDIEIISKKAQSLFNQRIKNVQSFWNKLSQQEVLELFGTAKIMDGDTSILESIVAEGKQNNYILYNLFNHFSNSEQKRNYYRSNITDKQILRKAANLSSSKKIAIFIPHTTWTGGMRMIFKLGDLLRTKGYTVDYYIPYNTTGKKHLFTVGPITEEVITYESDEAISTFSKEYNLAIATHWDLIYPLYSHFNKTVFYAQGDYDSFSNQPEKINLLKLFYSLPVFHMGVSSFLHHLMNNNYGRKAWIVPCGVDMEKFFYNPEITKENYILVIGDSQNVYKNTTETIENLLPTAKKLNTYIKWITPHLGSFPHDKVQTIINPKQEELIEIMQKAKVIVNGSLIEAFSLPPLEAMACGTPVVASNNMGILQYAVKDKNALLFPFKQYDVMQQHIETIFTDKEKVALLIEEGLKTAKDYADTTVNELNFELIKNEFIASRFIKP